MIPRKQGRIINIASIAGLIAAPAMSAYAASKFAVEAFSDSLRRESAAWGLRVTIIEPSFFATPILNGASIREAIDMYDSSGSTRRAAQASRGPGNDPMVACYIDSSFPAMLLFAYKYAESLEEGVLASANAGGE